MKQAIVFLYCMLFSFTGVSYGKEGPSLNSVKAYLSKAGGKATLKKYFDCEHYEGTAYRQIATGSKDWVDLAQKMLRYSDACYTEGITSALGKAMQKAPANVLPYVNTSPTLSADNICLPFIASELPVSEQLRQVRASKSAIQRAQTTSLRPQCEVCLHIIEKLEADLQQKSKK